MVALRPTRRWPITRGKDFTGSISASAVIGTYACPASRNTSARCRRKRRRSPISRGKWVRKYGERTPLSSNDAGARARRARGILPMMNTIGTTFLLTGGTGYIGSHTCVELLNAGYGTVVLDNLCNSSATVLDRIEKITGKRPDFI